MIIDWEFILDALTKGDVVPVIGNDLSLVKDENDKLVPLYEYIAGEITSEDKDSGDPHSIHELTLKPHAARIPHINQKIKFAYEKIKRNQKIYKKPLEDLAKITDFNFYVSTAIDDILEETIRNERDCTDGELEIINYSLQTKSPKPVTPKITVFKLMGNIHFPEHTAIDEEKMLEHLISISLRKNDDHPQIKHFIKNVTDKTFLFIGCDFPDWLMRFFMRISTNRRLIQIQTSPIDYVINKSDRKPHRMEVFLAHCQKELITLPKIDTDNAIDFVGELYQKWEERRAEKETIQYKYKETVFLSYHGKDVRYAENLKRSLEAEGIRVWFDKRDLTDGEHEKIIQEAIGRKCRVFIPLISGNLLEAPEHYARRVEWATAQKIYEVKPYTTLQFDIIPCIVDDSNSKDDRIPEFIKKFKIFNLKTEEAGIIDATKNKLKPVNAG